MQSLGCQKRRSGLKGWRGSKVNSRVEKEDKHFGYGHGVVKLQPETSTRILVNQYSLNRNRANLTFAHRK